MNQRQLIAISTIINDGTCVISTNHNDTLAIIQGTVNAGISATFYVSPAVAAAINAWYW
jgi:hypothetical protein